ncbi:MAG: (d)CMP kinase [Bacteroidales bacterium]|nr:(d)CMP kinase [Bacteroidales bacterium]
MKNPKIIIAIDGYSSTGKSTFAKLIAKELGYVHLDSGALYRAITLHALRAGMIDDSNRIDEDALLDSLSGLKISLRPEVYLGEENVESQIRQMDVSNSVSPVSAIPFVRSFVDDILRECGKEGGIVMDGRDIGTNVFPNAQLKIFMTATADERASRRYKEMIASGKQVTFEEVLKNLSERDYIDSHRSVSPLRQAEDAIVLDNTTMTMEDQMVWLKEILKDKFGMEF